MRSPENVLESLKSKACNKSYKYERLYRNLYNPQFYLLAYQRIQAKPGNRYKQKLSYGTQICAEIFYGDKVVR